MIDYSGAIDEIFALFKTAWDANTTDVVGYIPRSVGKAWKSATIPTHRRIGPEFLNKQLVRNSPHTEMAILLNAMKIMGWFLYSYSHLEVSLGGMENGRLLAVVARNAFRGKKTSGGVWFRNVTIKELDPEDSFYRLNVIAEYEYDEES